MREYFIWLAKLITIFVVIFIIVPVLLGMMAALAGGLLSEGLPAVGKTVAVIELEGEILDSKGTVKELYKQAENTKVKGTVLRVNSPGGAVGPSQEIYEAVKNLNARSPKKPVVVSMGAVAASGGLYSSLSGAKIFAEPGTMTGSIGVIMQLPNVQRLVDWAGVSFVTIKSGELKDIGNMFRPMTDVERAFLQSTIERVQEDFVKAVVESRKIPEEEVRKFADGRLIMGSQARDLRLIDAYGGVYDAARAVFELAGEPLKDSEIPHLFYPRDRFSELREALDNIASIPGIFSRQAQLKYLMWP